MPVETALLPSSNRSIGISHRSNAFPSIQIGAGNLGTIPKAAKPLDSGSLLPLSEQAVPPGGPPFSGKRRTRKAGTFLRKVRRGDISSSLARTDFPKADRQTPDGSEAVPASVGVTPVKTALLPSSNCGIAISHRSNAFPSIQIGAGNLGTIPAAKPLDCGSLLPLSDEAKPPG
ncbi:MAG: hypothetical protein R3F11_09310 [Verrucomicrobiales bacterium]